PGDVGRPGTPARRSAGAGARRSVRGRRCVAARRDAERRRGARPARDGRGADECRSAAGPAHEGDGDLVSVTARPRRFRADRLTSAWVLVALATSALAVVGRSASPQTLWTSVHVVTLGVLTSSVLQWSWYFARALLHLPAADRRSGRDARARMVAFH